MKPILFHLPLVNLPVYAYGTMLMFGFLAALWLATRLARRRGLPPEALMDLALAVMISGIVGARAFYVIQFREEFADQPLWSLVAIWQGGLVFQGGLAGGFLGGFFFLRWYQLPFWRMADVVAVVLPLGLAFGRLGCLLNGCCWGRVCPLDFPLGMTFPPGSPAYLVQQDEGLIGPLASRSLPVYPTQLMEFALSLAACGLLYLCFRRGRWGEGALLPAWGALYGAIRLAGEMLRVNPPGPLGLSVYSWISIGMFAGLLPLAVFLAWRRPAAGEVTLTAPPEGGK